MKKYHGDRKLLNLPGYESTAAIVAEIEDTSHWKKNCDEDGDKLTGKTSDYSTEPSIKFFISNCDRTIEFIFSFDEHSEENNLYKIDSFISALESFRQGLITEQERFRARKKKIEELKKKEPKKKEKGK